MKKLFILIVGGGLMYIYGIIFMLLDNLYCFFILEIKLYDNDGLCQEIVVKVCEIILCE